MAPGTQSQQNIGDFTVEKDFTDRPITVLTDDGRILKVQYLGNHAGHSPAYMGWDEENRPVIESVGRCRSLDVNTLPPSRAQVDRLLSQITQR
jgi:hypothetical protein